MPNTFNSNTFSSTYRDDYNDSDNYHRILYNSGRALQARELTQMQTIIQEEMARFGRNIFKDGARVSAGGITVDNDRKYVKISSVTTGGAFSDIQVGTVFTGATNNYTAKVLDVKPIAVDGFTANTLYLQYIGANGASGTPSTATAVFEGGETISGGGYQLVVDNTAGGVGSGTKLIVGEGSYFILGHFVFSPKQEIFLEAYSQKANAKVVFEVTEDVITVNDTQALYDNTGANPNLASPGADRYRIRMTLKKESDVSVGASSVYLCTIQNSRVSEEIPVFDGYNQIKHMIAQRTKEESGNYVVNPFLIQFEDRVPGDDNIDLIVNPGVAYVNGYRVQNQYAKRLALPRATSTELVNNQSLRTSYGNYVIGTSSVNMPALTGRAGLYSGTNGGGSLLGTCFIKAYSYDTEIPGGIRIYIYNTVMGGGLSNSISNAKSIGGAGESINLVQEDPNGDGSVLQTKIYGTENNTSLFKLPRPRAAGLTDISVTLQEFQTQTADVSGNVTLDQLPGGATPSQYVDTDRWIAYNFTANGSYVLIDQSAITLSNGDRDATIALGGSFSSATTRIYAYVKRPGTVKTKTATDATAGDPTPVSLATDPSGYQYYEFIHHDVFEIVEIRNGGISGPVITDYFLFDPRVTDNAYYKSRIILKEGREAPSTIYVSYKYWARGGGGNFYTGSSYQGVGIDYSDVPKHKLKNGKTIDLRNYVDFRSDLSDTIVLSQILMPRSGDAITADVEYYTPRADKLLITQEGELKVLMGAQSQNPQFKETPDNSLELYKIILNGFTVDENDLQVQSVEHKRYTMKDIAKLERKFDDFAATTQLSILELETKIAQLFDSSGVPRIDVGIKVDNFSDQTGTNTRAPDHTAAVDPESRTLRAGFDEDNIRLIIDSDASVTANARRVGDMVGINFTEVDWQAQPLASETLQVNPAGLIRNIGCVHLSPSSDEWKEVIYDAVPAQSGNVNVSGNTSYLWNEWQWNWAGRQSETTFTPNFYTGNLGGSLFGGGGGFEGKGFEGDYYASEETLNPNLSSNFVSRPLQNDTVREVFDNTTVDVALVPWIRSRKIYFRASGLKPDTRFEPFFDGINVADWCRKEAYVSWGDRSEDIGNQYQNITQHPDTPSTLYSDANGELEGSFVIPNVRPTEGVQLVNGDAPQTEAGLRFRSGIKEFKLVDVTVTDITSAGSSASSYYVAKGAFERRTANVTSTRPVESTWSGPQVFPGHIFPYYSSRELQNLADLVTSGEFYMIEPHPSGQWAAGDAAALPASYDASNTMSQLLSDYVTVDENQYAGTVDLPTPVTNNPMAQSFYVDNQFGLTLTEIKLFFAKKDANLPVQIQIRPIEDGAPSLHEIVPNSCVFKNSADVTETLYTPGSTLLSTVQGSPTTFKFMEPVFLKPFTNYALIVASESPEYEVYVAKALNYVIGPTGSQRILSQPAPGEMFLPQNGTQWLPSKDYDLMYTMVRARYDTNASVVLGNADVPGKLLKSNPIITTLGSSEIFVKHPNHGLDSSTPDSLVLTVQGSLSAAGFTEATLNGSHTVVFADAKGVVVDVGSNATETTAIGGDAIIASRNIQYAVANPYLETLVPPVCSIDVTGRFTTGRTLREGNGETKYAKDLNYTRITPGQNITFEAPRLVADPAIQSAQLGAGVKSVDIKLNLTSGNDYVSPYLDLQRASMYLIANEIDNDSRDELLPFMGDDNGGSRQIGEVIALTENPAAGAQVSFDANLPTGTSHEFYTRTSPARDEIEEQPWVRQYPINDIAPGSGVFTPQRIEYLVGGQGGFEPEFNQFQHKIVLKSTNMAVTPEIRNLSIKFLGL